METTLELGFALGFIAGEGSFSGDRVQPALSVRVVASDADSLRVLQRVFGGKIYGPYHAKPPRQSVVVWILRGPELSQAITVIDAHLPPSRKRHQFDVWYQKWWLHLAKAVQ